ncbi:MAG: glycine--tRNA ligase subunit beta [Candidatus Desulfofervidaceae bacterium]|nr:glycine--tRNA ligase subunit beta [Candidatus Desulfofervidaceae bacterium]
MSKTLLLEIGTEELPVSIFPKILADMETLLAKKLAEAGLSYKHINPLATPRRLVVFVTGLPEKQADKVEEVIGPPYRVAFDNEGKPTKAAFGFAQKQGVSVEALQVIDTPKGQYVGVKIHETGRPTAEVLAELLPGYILSLPFPKSMRWHTGKIRFARPIHWILALLDEKTIPLSLDGIKSENVSYGHRFVTKEPIIVSHPDNYLPTLEKYNVIVDHKKREKLIVELVEKAAQATNGKPLLDADLLNWVNFLVEYPVAVAGQFDQEFLNLPEAVLITVMKHHQKYFAITDIDGHLLPAFVAVINTPVTDLDSVKTGLERVLRARLADARFFYESDLKTPLSNRVSQLKGVIFQADLGTVWEKTERLKQLCAWLAEVTLPEKKDTFVQAAFLCKADLTTEMVNEFPELQGIMGGIYAQKQGEPEEVARAISEHYLPTEAGGELPQSFAGALLSLADKIDTIIGCFGVGLTPTGTTDPFALRRQAIGIVRILNEKDIPLSLLSLIELGLKAYADRFEAKKEEIKTQVLQFFKNRLAHLLMEKGNDYAVTEAILAVFDGDIPAAFAKAEALTTFSKSAQFEPLVIAYKRAHRIIEAPVTAPPKPELFVAPEEKSLYEKYLETKEKVEKLLVEKSYKEALETLGGLKSFIDDFFDHVMVMVDDEVLRKNRLALLTQVKQLFLKVADLSKIPI